MKEQENKKKQILQFLLLGTHMCMYIKYVKKILPLMSLEIIPNSPSYIVGMLNLSGKSIPVIDLATRLGMQRTSEYSLDQPIVLCGVGEYSIGMIVDKIIDLQDVQDQALQVQKEFIAPNSFFTALVVSHSEQSLLLDIPQILNIKLTL